MDWYVYIIRCSDSTLYTGITTDIAKRYLSHANATGAKYFRGRKPESIVYLESGHNRSSASQREMTIKKLSKHGKLSLINTSTNELC